MLIYFSVRTPNNSFKKFKLREGEFVTIGRGDRAVVKVNDDLLSSLHSKIYIKNGELYIEDLDSKNGTVVQGMKINKQRLYLEDRIQVGQTFISVDIGKITPEDKNKITYKGKHSDKSRSLTLELESVTEKRSQMKKQRKPGTSTRRQKDFVKKSKLYKDSFTDKKGKNNDGKKEAIALQIDIALTFCVYLGVVFSSKVLEPNLWKEAQMNIEFFTNNLQDYTFGGLLIAVVFHLFNRRSKKGSIAERMLGL